jgi:hypothetical protein
MGQQSKIFTPGAKQSNWLQKLLDTLSKKKVVVFLSRENPQQKSNRMSIKAVDT